jgi:hypothetical protein
MAVCMFSVTIAIEERHVLTRALAWSVAMIVFIAAFLILPPLYGFDQSIRSWYAAMIVVPQAVVLAIPIGIALGIAFGLSARPTMNIAKVMLLGAAVASILSFGVLTWAMPAANHAFREMTVRELQARGDERPVAGLQKGYNEMTFSELRSEIARFTAEGALRQARQYEFRLHLRIALAAATFALASVLLAAASNHRGLRGRLALGACFTYWVLMFTGDWGSRSGHLTPLLGAWLPNVVLIGFAIFVASSRSRLRGSLSSAR